MLNIGIAVRKTTQSKSLAGISALAFLAGLPFPILANFSNPHMAYGIVYVSIPAWAIGVFTAALAINTSRARNLGTYLITWISSGLLLLNMAAFGFLLVIPFYAS